MESPHPEERPRKKPRFWVEKGDEPVVQEQRHLGKREPTQSHLVRPERFVEQPPVLLVCSPDIRALGIELLEDEVLQHCFVGMKMEAYVKDLSIGLEFIDCYEAGYVSFFTWLWNERIRNWKEPGRPTGWMERVNAVKRGDAVVEVAGA